MTQFNSECDRLLYFAHLSLVKSFLAEFDRLLIPAVDFGTLESHEAQALIGNKYINQISDNHSNKITITPRHHRHQIHPLNAQKKSKIHENKYDFKHFLNALQ